MIDNKAFTLVELIVWITLSLILMMSVSLFVSSGMQNILTQQKVIDESSHFIENTARFQNFFHLIDSSIFIPTTTASWVIFKINKEYSSWGFAYFWEETLSWSYCLSDSETPETNHVFLKTFIPFEEQWEDIFSNFKQTLTGSIIVWLDTYISDQKHHTVSKNWDIIIWKGIFWDQFIDWVSGTGIYLNSPTGLAHDGINLYISDTLNNRILYLDSSNTMHVLLDEKDGLSEPTGLYFSNNSLYIANSAKWEILEYSSWDSDKKMNIKFAINKTINDVRNVSLEFLSWAINITEPDNTNDFAFVGINKNIWNDYLSGSTNQLLYYFSDFWNNYSTQTNQLCSWTGPFYNMDSWELIKETFDSCSGTWTLRKWRNSTIQNIPSWTTIEINTSNDTAWSWPWNTGSYYTHTIISWATDTYERYDYLFTVWDDNLTTKDDNNLSIYSSWLNYPTWIWWTWISDYNSFSPWIQNLPFSKDYDTLLNSPLESLNLTLDNTNKLFTAIIKYYRVYNCYNPDEKNMKTWVLKKNLK